MTEITKAAAGKTNFNISIHRLAVIKSESFRFAQRLLRGYSGNVLWNKLCFFCSWGEEKEIHVLSEKPSGVNQ